MVKLCQWDLFYLHYFPNRARLGLHVLAPQSFGGSLFFNLPNGSLAVLNLSDMERGCEWLWSHILSRRAATISWFLVVCSSPMDYDYP